MKWRLGCFVVLVLIVACSVAVTSTRVVCPEPEHPALPVGGEPSD